MRDPSRAAILNSYPLVDARITRAACLTWWETHAPPGAPPIGRSACYCCPYLNTTEWRDIRSNHPDLWASALEIDEAVRGRFGGAKGYLHRRRIPLAVAAEQDDSQPDLFGGECEGMCGV